MKYCEVCRRLVNVRVDRVEGEYRAVCVECGKVVKVVEMGQVFQKG